jgi:Zn-dependent protease with chaperone function
MVLDLAVDLYEEERNADRYAAEQMDTPAFLISALTKLRLESEEAAGRTVRQQRRQSVLQTDSLMPLWDAAWAAYLHPDVDQRIRWLTALPRRLT